MLSEESLDYEGGQKQEEETKVQKDNQPENYVSPKSEVRQTEKLE